MIKRASVIIFAACGILALSACGNKKQSQVQSVIERPQQNVSQENTTDTQSGNSSKDSNILIAYFTVPETDGVDTVAGASRGVKGNEVLGNTQYIASEIQKNLGGDIFAIKTVNDYPGTHSALLDYAYKEKGNNERPALSAHIDNLDKYDYIFVGFPNWNADLPMPLYTFFDEYDFSGKTIIPFVTHGGSGFSGTINTIKKLEPGATVVDSGLSVSRNDVAGAQEAVKAWTDALIKDRKSVV